MARATACLAVFLLLAACDAPRDPDGTVHRIRASHMLRAGLSENRPWIWLENGRVRGPEADLVIGFAHSLGARVNWSWGSESRLLPQLEQRNLDIVAGGFTTSTPWSSMVGTTRAYRSHRFFQERHVLLTAPGENNLLLRLDRFLKSRAKAGA